MSQEETAADPVKEIDFRLEYLGEETARKRKFVRQYVAEISAFESEMKRLQATRAQIVGASIRAAATQN